MGGLAYQGPANRQRTNSFVYVTLIVNVTAFAGASDVRLLLCLNLKYDAVTKSVVLYCIVM